MSVFLSGLGLLTDVYDLQVVNLARPLIALAHDMSPSSEALITSAAIVGATCGMLVFGALADRLGRRSMFLMTAGLTSLGAIGSACARREGSGVYAELAAWRFVMGVGIGGEYPLSAANSAEHGTQRGGQQIALTYSMMGWGGLLAPVVFICLQLARLPPAHVWRLGFAFGGLMSLTGTVLRLAFLADSPKFARAREDARAKQQGGYAKQTALVLARYWRPLLGTAGTWLVFDVYEYGLNLYTSDVLRAAGLTRSGSPLDTSLGVLCLRLATIPGYIGSIWLLGALGRRQTLAGGFVAMGAVFLALGVFWERLLPHPYAFALLFGAAQVLNNAGCNAATYVIPAEIFPSSIRATCHGLSAAAGKVGAALGSATFPLVSRSLGLSGVFVSCALLCALGFALAMALIPNYDDATLPGLDAAHLDGSYLKLLYGTGGGHACNVCAYVSTRVDERSRRKRGAVRLGTDELEGHSVELEAVADLRTAAHR